MATATEITIEHYQRPEVREIIKKWTLYDTDTTHEWRALNGDFHAWYRYSGDGYARLLDFDQDYDYVISEFRTLYATLNVFDPGLWTDGRLRASITSENPLGTPAETAAYTLGVDIDKGHGCNIEDASTKLAVESAAQFLVDYLKDNGVHDSVWALFSGGGIYVELHHEICKPKSAASKDRQEFYELATGRFNRFIAHVSDEFFKAHPEHVGRVKYDALNNSKRVFKCILSIHKKKPYAVTPLNRDAIKIDFDRARIPLKDDMIDEARAWYSSYDPAEKAALFQLLDGFEEAEEKSERHFSEIWRSSTKIDAEHFPPCMQHILDVANEGEGKTRFTAVLSAFLYQMGWDEDEAWALAKAVSDRNGLGNADHIFDSCFGRISCPSCKTILEDGAGYPHLGLKGLGACRQVDGCDRWPGDYAVSSILLGEGVVSEDEFKAAPRTFNPKLEVHLEPSNFLSKYMAYARTTSDAYEEYHFASGLVLLSVAADRTIVVSMCHGDIYPNIWVFGIGDSTISRKTTAHKLCKLILKTKYMKKSLPSSFSPEALMDAISQTPRCYYLKDEAGSLLSSLCKDYMAETRDFMAEIYECDDYYRKLKKSECVITDPYISQYLMTTPDNLKEYTSPLDLTSGWLLRYMWMYPNYPKAWKPFAEKDSSDLDRYTTIYGEYNLVASKLTTPRSLSLTSEAMQFFQEWQRGIEDKAMEEADNVTKALAGRLMTHTIKMATLFTIGREDFDENSKIELPHIQEAARLIDCYFLPIGKIIVEEVARSETKNTQEKILGILKRFNGRVSQRDLLRNLHMKIADVEDAIEGLILSEEIQRVQVKGKKGTTLYYASVKSKTEECNSVIVSHQEVYKGKSTEKNNIDPNIHLYTSPLDTITLKQVGQDEAKDRNDPTIGPHPRKEDPGFTKFQERVRTHRRNTCLWCGQHFEIPLVVSVPGGFICAKCEREGKPSEPVKPDSQMKLELAGTA